LGTALKHGVNGEELVEMGGGFLITIERAGDSGLNDFRDRLQVVFGAGAKSENKR
jgi:hypothetical protein